ncbi:YhcB family protein [Agitococcus lubricus]|uniref:Z-ring associated protein G n=1 Tax=Agitococcus lubricus TaxID=1077255 RepID=A0A2T5J0Q9_9GAMM|nr:DUF1043 family protein [Agitococcus lubricus]PTQ89895.1 hypothetical protein C8N29_105224 [Agitococcus lubricus]
MGWLLYVLVFAAGLAIGYFLPFYRNNDSRVRELEDHLKTLQAKYEHYQETVTAHFSHSAQLVNNLTNAYREVHEHLQKGAHELCADNKRHTASNPATAFLSLESPKDAYPQPVSAEDDKFLATIEPPRDYATKSPHDKGTLDEEYGFK